MFSLKWTVKYGDYIMCEYRVLTMGEKKIGFGVSL